MSEKVTTALLDKVIASMREALVNLDDVTENLEIIGLTTSSECVENLAIKVEDELCGLLIVAKSWRL